MLRRRWATSRSTDSSPFLHGVGGVAYGDGDDDDLSGKLRHWATSHRSGQPCWGRLQVKPPSPGSAREPAPPALRRTAPQSTGKQYASYPSPSLLLDGIL